MKIENSFEKNIKVLIVDDSAIVRKVLSTILAAAPGIEVVGTAPDPYVARDKILALSPDVLTLDLEMPRMDGLTFLDRLMTHHPLPVIILSSLAKDSASVALEALRRGAVEVMAKPGGPYSVGDLANDLPQRIRAAAAVRRGHGRAPQVAPQVRDTAPAPRRATSEPRSAVDLIAIGASTGGTVAIEELLTRLPEHMPPIAIVQHIPAGFSAAFANRLNRVCKLRVEEAVEGARLEAGLVLVAPGNRHMVVERQAGTLRVRLDDGPKVHYQRPAVDVMFRSVLETRCKCTAVLLTGMGDDGADAMRLLHDSGVFTMAQSEETCVVYGMPREAVRVGAVDRSASPSAIAEILTQRFSTREPIRAA
jgi:two-component system chemotaxis response regulator CheB